MDTNYEDIEPYHIVDIFDHGSYAIAVHMTEVADWQERYKNVRVALKEARKIKNVSITVDGEQV